MANVCVKFKVENRNFTTYVVILQLSLMTDTKDKIYLIFFEGGPVWNCNKI